MPTTLNANLSQSNNHNNFTAYKSNHRLILVISFGEGGLILREKSMKVILSFLYYEIKVEAFIVDHVHLITY